MVQVNVVKVMEDALKILNELQLRIEYGDITRDQIINYLSEIKDYLEV